MAERERVWVIRVCPVCNRVKEASMGCTGAHEAAHEYARTLRIEVVRADAYQGAVDLLRSLPAVTLSEIVDDERGTAAAQATAAAELTRRRSGA